MRLVLISLDGLWEGDFAALENLPNIGGLIREGVSCKRVQTVYPALTYPVHATLLTGCPPAMHGIAHNQPFAPDLMPDMRPWYWDSAQLKRPTLHQLIREKGGETASILWPVTGKNASIRWNFPEVLALPGENQTMKMLRHGSPLWILKTELLYGRRRKSVHQPDLDDYAALLAQKLLTIRRPPDLLSLHLVDCDETRHHFGADSQEARAAIRRLDERVGRILRALERRGILWDTAVALVSDHGLCDVDRIVSLEEAFAQAGLADICRVQSTGMGAFLFVSRDRAENRGLVEGYLEANRERLGISRIYGEEELRLMGAGMEVHLAVEAAPGVAFEDTLPKEKRERATHGFGPGHPAAQCLFILAGPGIKKGASLPSAQMEDIAPTLAKVMGHKMSSAQGRILEECFR
jgi:predicted AlkP superfamily pyrophosphatase or phosphodiesterase